jgi:Fic family protein
MMSENLKEITSTPYLYYDGIVNSIARISERVKNLRKYGSLKDPQALRKIRKYFKLKQIYHSNAIEGNQLDIGETRQVIEMGLTITGKSLKDQSEAKNLSEAIDLLEDIAIATSRPITENDIKQIHGFILKDIDNTNAGSYRKTKVVISGSAHTPPEPFDISPQMSDFSKWLAVSSIPGDRFASEEGLLIATVAHTWFVSIHPFIDGNGRTARLLMNLILMRFGYPIAIILKEDRMRYYDALEESQSSNLTPMLNLLVECLEESIEEYEHALEEQQEHLEWAQAVAGRLSEKERIRTGNEYEVWKSAMELLKSNFKMLTTIIDDQLDGGRIFFADFGNLEFEKYASLKRGDSTKRTWFFRVDFNINNRKARYLFFFGYPSHSIRSKHCDVSLFISREQPTDSFYYERLDNITAFDLPSMREVGYSIHEERFFQRQMNNAITAEKSERIAQNFIEEVSRHFG